MMSTHADPYAETISVPAAARFPIELRPPAGFRADQPWTWPRVEGSLEYVQGRLLYMPPSADVQQDVVGSVAGILDRWMDAHPEFTFGTNEAGMLLGGDVRAADAAVWRRDAAGPYKGRYRSVPPILAIEVAGQSEDDGALRDKATWYLEHGVKAVWIVLPATREVLVIRPGSEARFGSGQKLPEHPDLPALQPDVDRIFARLQ